MNNARNARLTPDMIQRVVGFCKAFDANTLSATFLDEAAKMFSDNYGIWGPLAASCMCKPQLAQGRPVRVSPSFLRKHLIPISDSVGEATEIENLHVRAIVNGELWGTMFATIWHFRGMTICWVTQLVVLRNKRSIGIAKRMLFYIGMKCCERGPNCVVGLLSSHPAAIRACYRAFGNSSNADASGAYWEFIRERARAIMGSCPVDYVRTASERLKGNCFLPSHETVVDGDWCCANTEFYVDHEESDRVLRCLKDWPFKRDLPDGHEYLALFPICSTFK